MRLLSVAVPFERLGRVRLPVMRRVFLELVAAVGRAEEANLSAEFRREALRLGLAFIHFRSANRVLTHSSP